MEYMDFTLYDYINKRNNELSKSERKVIVAQIIKAFDYISSKNISKTANDKSFPTFS